MKKHTLWLTEFLVWVLVLFTALFIGVYSYSVYVKKNYTYYAFFNDVDGLIKGSPVKMLGYQIGYVSGISLINDDDVFVSFIITDKDINMPESMVATVEFTGMGGSKSLELTPASSKDKKNIITVTQPRRVQDIYVNQTVIAQNLVLMSTGFMKMANDRTVAALKTFIKNPKELGEINTFMDDVNEQQSTLLKKVKSHEKRF